MIDIVSFLNLPLVIVGISIGISIILGAIVFLNDRKNITNKTFLLFSTSAILWNIVNYLFYQPHHSQFLALLLLRLVIFFAVWYCFFLFQFFYVFLENKNIFKIKYYISIFTLTVMVSLITLTPLVFKQIMSFDLSGRVGTVSNGFGIYIFGAFVVFLITSGLFVLIFKFIKAKSKSVESEQLIYILIGAILTFTLHVVFNMILPAFFNISQYTALGAVFTLPFSIFTSFAIIKYRLFNVKVIATELIVFILWFLLLARTLMGSSLNDQVISGGLFAASVVVGVLLIKSIMREVNQREKLEIMTAELKDANDSLQNFVKQRESLIHLVTHKVKGSFTRSKYIFVGMLDGTFGEISEEIKKRAQQGLDSDNGGIETVDLVLNAANLGKGEVRYDMKPIDIKTLVEKAISEKKIAIDNKGLKLETEIKSDETYNVIGDAFWLKEVFYNLIDNAVKYTKEGKIIVGISKNDAEGNILFYVKDTGVGITDEDKCNLFKEGGRGKNSVKVNVDSTGYGLYTVKLIVDGHGGKVWTENNKDGVGSTFFVQLNSLK